MIFPSTNPFSMHCRKICSSRRQNRFVPLSGLHLFYEIVE
ncbi:hypothetical protein HMPREF3293_01093 [Christensenella minuta]|uniref:Uncharacterized protein n=1 Tax=Christensenella minuta TaxID=626937 RepID=A0A136Q5V5_9FIRM|nr:hypothetical protein HMPREF3293_01093 [Christensenella minuta]